jgi:HD-GYP domain-containing protein (c-di-GMP phosphodiesterase class II)
MGTPAEDGDQHLQASTIGAQTATQAGFLPVPLRNVPSAALRGMPIYIRNDGKQKVAFDEPFVLYRGADTPFTADDRRRLMGGTPVVFIQTADHALFRKQAECSILDEIQDPTKAAKEKAALVYDTCIELMNELLGEPDLTAHAGRIEGMTRAITTSVLSDQEAFTHLFSVSNHDYYTATHMVNVGTWMVPLAYALGHTDPDDLMRICQAGLLHDLGKLFINADVLNKKGQLTVDELKEMRRHPVLGWEQLKANDSVSSLARDVCRQHHERPDGKGYPDRLSGDQIHRISKICTVVDVFDSMTALRPYKESALSVSEAILALRAGVPNQFDGDIVNAWIKLLAHIDDRSTVPATPTETDELPTGVERRRHKRFQCDCEAHLHPLITIPGAPSQEGPRELVRIVNVSRYGLGIVADSTLPEDKSVHVYMVSSEDGSRSNRRLRGRIVRCRQRDDGKFDVGVELFAAGDKKPTT